MLANNPPMPDETSSAKEDQVKQTGADHTSTTAVHDLVNEGRGAYDTTGTGRPKPAEPDSDDDEK